MSLLNGPGFMTLGETQKGGDFYPYSIENSIWFDGAADYLYRDPSVTGDTQKFTTSFWLKRTSVVDTLLPRMFGAYEDYIGFDQYNRIHFILDEYVPTADIVATDFRVEDVVGWYHVFLIYNSTEATASDRLKLWINGLQLDLTYNVDIPLNHTSDFNLFGRTQTIARKSAASSRWYDGYLAEIHFLDGTVNRTADQFGEFNNSGVWVPKKYTGGSYGTNGYYLTFESGAQDYSGNNNDFTPVSIIQANQVIDTPTNNFPVFNSLPPVLQSLISDGNLTGSLTSGGWWKTGEFQVVNIPLPSTGVWYAEFTPTAGGEFMVGVTDPVVDNYTAGCCLYWSGIGMFIGESGYVYGDTWGIGNIIGFRADCDEGEVECYIDGTSQGIYSFDPSNKAFAIASAWTSGPCTISINCGQYEFQSLPSGAQALSYNNLPTPDIDPSEGFVAQLRDGTGIVTDVDLGMQPDVVWIKSYSTTYPHRFYNSSRGPEVLVQTEDNQAEFSNAIGLTSFNTNGYSLGLGDSYENHSSQSYVDWCWKEGSTYGLDIVEYTGNGSASHSISHSLGDIPTCMIIKRLNSTGSWVVYHQGMGNTSCMYLDTDASLYTSITLWNNTDPTNTTFTVGNGSGVNTNTGEYIAYLFTDIPGYSKFGTYTGNSDADGPFGSCDFRPAFVIVKRVNSVGSWSIFDSARTTHNTVSLSLYADTDAANYLSNQADLLSNGFKIRTIWHYLNTNAAPYIYMAFAKYPMKQINPV